MAADCFQESIRSVQVVNNSKKTSRDNWVEASGLPYLFRALGMAVHPSKINLALIGIVLTVALGWSLDMVWIGDGVDGSSIERFVSARRRGSAVRSSVYGRSRVTNASSPAAFGRAGR